MGGDGSVEGWFIALCTTIVVYGLLVAGFFNDTIARGWDKMGSHVTTIYPLSFGSWLAYKAAKAIAGKE